VRFSQTNYQINIFFNSRLNFIKLTKILFKFQIDILRDASDKVIKYEATIDSYKKKLEELSSLKRQLKLLEDNNTSLLQANLALENDVKKTGNWKPQVMKTSRRSNLS
jgi:hypothetical protein